MRELGEGRTVLGKGHSGPVGLRPYTYDQKQGTVGGGSVSIGSL